MSKDADIWGELREMIAGKPMGLASLARVTPEQSKYVRRQSGGRGVYLLRVPAGLVICIREMGEPKCRPAPPKEAWETWPAESAGRWAQLMDVDGGWAGAVPCRHGGRWGQHTGGEMGKWYAGRDLESRIGDAAETRDEAIQWALEDLAQWGELDEMGEVWIESACKGTPITYASMVCDRWVNLLHEWIWDNFGEDAGRSMKLDPKVVAQLTAHIKRAVDQWEGDNLGEPEYHTWARARRQKVRYQLTDQGVAWEVET